MWNCPICGSNNVGRCKQCSYCFGRHGIITPRPSGEYYEYDSFDEDIFKVTVAYIDSRIGFSISEERLGDIITGHGEEKPMTPQEELFKEFFSATKQAIKDMPILELRAYREELANIAFEARAKLTAVDDEEKERKKAGKASKGFQASVQTDEVTTEAINKIKSRQGKLTREDKIMQGLLKMGVSAKDAQAMLSAGHVLSTVRNKGSQELNAKTDIELSVKPTEPVKPPYNPFASKIKQEPIQETEVTIIEETNTVIVSKQSVEEPITEESKPINKLNPFAR